MPTRPPFPRPWSPVLCRTVAAAAGCAALLVVMVSCHQTTRQTAPDVTEPATAPAASAPASQPAAVECRWTEQPITIDGKADEEAWQHAQVVDDFRFPGPTAVERRRPHTATKARLLWDREYLYYFAEMADADLFAKVTEHNGIIWEDDVFEVFLKPAEDKPGYYEFEVNPNNARMELFLPKRNDGGWLKYKDLTTIEHKTAVQLNGTLNERNDTDKGWSVEGRIRWQDLAPTGGRPNVDERWLFALCRGDVSAAFEKPDLMSSAPLTKVDFHRYEDYATVRFVGPTKTSAVKPYGIDSRSEFTKSKVIGFPEPPPPYGVTRPFPKLKVFQPIYLVEEPGTDNLICIQHLGSWAGPAKVIRFKNDPEVDTAETLLEANRIAYAIAFHPEFLKNGLVYFVSNGPEGADRKQDRISRYTFDLQTRRLDPNSELVILEWDSNGHNGGDLAFGPDGYLYHCSGDGTTDSDTNLRGQDLSHLESKMLRIDVDHPDAGRNYSVPKDNPFVGQPNVRPETWAYGFRNPWRIAFDQKTGVLWVGQNGQDAWEQVYVVRKGENYGWSIQEGGHAFLPNRQRGPQPITPPVIDHPHSEMRSLTGGIVYYGEKYPDLNGAYLYGDFSTGRIWAARYDGTKITWRKEIARTTLQVVGFRADKHGDVFVLDDGGGIWKLELRPAATTPLPPFPTRLSDTGLFTDVKNHVPDPGLIPYDVNSPLWSDGAYKERFIALPAGEKIDVNPTRGWGFTNGAVLVKSFSLETEAGNPAGRKHVETRLLTRAQGQWYGYSYVWNDDQTDATLVEAAGRDKDFTIRDPSAAGGVRTQTWHYPSRTECMVCHTRASGFVLGLSTLQMNKDHDYATPAGSVVRDNQLRVLEHLGVLHTDYPGYAREAIRKEVSAAGFKGPAKDAEIDRRTTAKGQREPQLSSLLSVPPAQHPALPDPSDMTADLASRAKSYLHANCAICHVEAGGGNAAVDLEWTTPADKTRIFGASPQHDSFGMPDARIIAPGDPGRSTLFHRLSTRGPGQMPPLATNRPDPEAVKLIHDWIAGMKPVEGPTIRPAGQADAR